MLPIDTLLPTGTTTYPDNRAGHSGLHSN